MAIKYKILISILVIAVAIIAVCIFIIAPTVKQVADMSQKIEMQREQLEQQYKAGQLLKKSIADFEQIKPQREKISSIFIREGNELELITQLETIASQNGVIQTIHLDSLNKKKQGIYSSLPIRVSVTGEFSNVMNYLQEFENLEYVYNAGEITITGPSKNTNEISLSLSGEIYVTQ